MKTKMQKIIAMIAVIAIMMTIVPATVGAYRIGDVIGYAKPTNIAATINGYQLTSYNVDGNTYVIAEELAYYGFNVSYDNSSRSIRITKNNGVSYIQPQHTSPYFYSVGLNTSSKKILYTDIATYVDGTWVRSYNIDGNTIIKFDDLAVYGEVAYDNSSREISLTVWSLEYNPLVVFLNSNRQLLLNAMQNAFSGVKGFDVILRAKGDTLVFDFTAHSYVPNPTASEKRQIQRDLDNSRDEIAAAYRQLMGVAPLNSVLIIIRQSDGAVVASMLANL